MVDERTLAIFVPAMLAMIALPGADTLFVVASAVRGGPHAGAVAALGIISGGTVYITLATVGLSTLILKSAIAFALLKYAGAAYLLYLGVRALLARNGNASARKSSLERVPDHNVFRQGFITNVLNPKAALFIVAFFPQFVSPARGAVWAQMLELGLLWYATGLIWLIIVGISVGRLRGSTALSPVAGGAIKYVTAGIFIGLAIRVAFS